MAAGAQADKNAAGYLEDLKANGFTANGAWWGDLNMLAVFRVANAPKVFGDSLAGVAKKILLDEANSLRSIGDTSAYRLPMSPGTGTGAAIAPWRTTALCFCRPTS